MYAKKAKIFCHEQEEDVSDRQRFSAMTKRSMHALTEEEILL